MHDLLGPAANSPKIVLQERFLALDQLRGFVVLLVVIHHCVTSYAVLSRFDITKYLDSSAPIVDPRRWLGFDVFLLFTENFFMSLMFLLSGLFVWQGLHRHGAAGFLRGRLLRLGLPYVAGLLLLMPVAYYPSFRAGGGAGGLLHYWWQTAILGPRPNGPLWFIAVLLIFDAVAAAMHVLWQDWSRWPAQWVRRHGEQPVRVFVVLLAVSLLAYLPLLLRFGPARWVVVGPVLIQASRALLYGVHFAAGVVAGRAGLGLLSGQGSLARHWRGWLLFAAATYGAVLAWRLTPLAAGLSPWAGRTTSGVIFTLDCCAIGFACLAVFLRFAGGRGAVRASLSANAYGIFLVHYLPMIWLQAALVRADLPAVAKAALVLTLTLAVSWAVVSAARRVPAVRAVV